MKKSRVQQVNQVVKQSGSNRGPERYLNIPCALIAFTIVLVIGVACTTDPPSAASPTASPTDPPTPLPTVTPAPTATPAATATPVPVETFTVMTYNILLGAGTTPLWAAEAVKHNDLPGNRLPQVLEVIKAADPDILGLQEIIAWDAGTADAVATELGMQDYVIGLQGGCCLTVGLFTKHTIVEVDNYSDPAASQIYGLGQPIVFGRGGMRVALQTAGGHKLQVFVAHFQPGLDSARREIRRQEIDMFLGEMDAYLGTSPILLIGDMNDDYVKNYSTVARRLYDADYCLVAHASIDQVWSSPQFAELDRFAFPSELVADVSDHRPVAVSVGLYPDKRQCR